ncbi:MAG: MAPEG family protein [Pseudomonadota bacterium]
MSAIIAPLLVQVALTFVMLFWMGSSRVTAAKRPEIRAALKEGQSPSYGRTPDLLSDNLKNQFEFPVLFYAGVVLAIAADNVTSVLVVFAWVFALSRIAHAAIHVTVNHVRTRFLVFAFGANVLLLYWIVLGLDLLTR